MEKINLIFFFCCFWKNVGENKFKFIFSAVFGKTLEKINLNLFFLLFLEKRWRNKFKFIFSAVLVKKRWRKKI